MVFSFSPNVQNVELDKLAQCVSFLLEASLSTEVGQPFKRKIGKPGHCSASWCSLLDLRGGNISTAAPDLVATLTSDGPERKEDIIE